MSEYTQAVNTTLRLIIKKGIAVEITYLTAGTYNTATGVVTPTDTVETAYGVFATGNKEIRDSNSQLVVNYDKKMLIAASGITEPKKNDRVSVNLKDYEIVAMNVLAPAGEAILYELWLKA